MVRISKFIVVTTFIFSIAIACIQQAARVSNGDVGCLTAKLSPYSDKTYLLDITNGQLMLKSMLATRGLGSSIDNVALDFSNSISRVYEAYNASEKVAFIAVDAQTGQRYTASLQNQSPQYLNASSDGKYLAVITRGTQGKLDVYHLPDLQLVLSRAWSPPADFQDISWSRAGHKLAFLEQGANSQALMTMFDPDNMRYSSAVISPDIQPYSANGYSSINWASDSEALIVHNDARIDMYLIKSETVQSVIDGAALHYEPGVGTPSITWIGNTHLLTYPPHDTRNGVALWVYDPDTGTHTLIGTQANHGVLYSPDTTYALYNEAPDENQPPSTILLNLLTHERIVVRENVGIMFNGSWQWIEPAKLLVISYDDEILRMNLDGSNRRYFTQPHARIEPLDNQGEMFAYVTAEQGPAEVGLVDFDTGANRRLGNVPEAFGNFSPSPDGHVLAFMTAGTPILSLFAVDGSWSSEFRTNTGEHPRLLWSPDSSQIALETAIYGQENTFHILSAHGVQLRQLTLPIKEILFWSWTACKPILLEP